MTDKVQKIKEWISKEQDGLMDANGNFEYPEHEGAYHILCNLDAYIDSLQEEPVSEELEEFANKDYKNALNSVAVNFMEAQGITPNLYAEQIIRAVKHGAKWQKEQDQSTIELAEDHAMLAGMEKMKEQMMAKAIDAEVLENYDGKVIKYDETILDEKLSDCKVFDKVKVIIIKED